MTPIIVVSSSPTSLITMCTYRCPLSRGPLLNLDLLCDFAGNIKRFLEEGVWVISHFSPDGCIRMATDLGSCHFFRFESTKDARESLAARGQFSVDNFMTVTRRMGTEGRKYVVVEGFEGLLKISQNRPDDVWYARIHLSRLWGVPALTRSFACATGREFAASSRRVRHGNSRTSNGKTPRRFSTMVHKAVQPPARSGPDFLSPHSQGCLFPLGQDSARARDPRLERHRP